MANSWFFILQLLGIHFTTTVHQTAQSTWSTVTGRTDCTACDPYYRELSSDKGVPTSTIICWLRHGKQHRIFRCLNPARDKSIRQLLDVCGAETFLVYHCPQQPSPPPPTPQPEAAEEWELLHVAAKGRALLFFRLRSQIPDTGSLTSEWLRTWDLPISYTNPLYIDRILPNVEYLHQ